MIQKPSSLLASSTTLVLSALTCLTAQSAACGDSSTGSPPLPDQFIPPDASQEDSTTTDSGAMDSGADLGADTAPPVTPLITGTYAAGATWGPTVGTSSPNYQGGLWGDQTLTFNEAGEMLKLSNVGWSITTTGPLPEFGADGLVAWGRWSTGTSTTGGPVAMEGFNYIAGKQAPSAANIKSTYSAFAATAPTAWTVGNVAIGTPNQITGTVTYSGGTVSYTLSNIVVGGQSFSISGSTGLYAGTGFLASGTVSGTACDAGCAPNITNAPLVQGWFLGTSGERAALNFGFTSNLGTVSGAVVFK